MKIKLGKDMVDIPTPELVFRKTNDRVKQAFLDAGESTITSTIAANRVSDMSAMAYQDLIEPTLQDLDIWTLQDIDVAAERILTAYQKNHVVALATDFDVDGITSAVLMKRAMVEFMGFPEENVNIFINVRMEFGYGLTDKAVDNIIEKSGDHLPDLVITADQGSKDNKNIAYFKSRMDALGKPNADVIITDHHEIDGACPEALAFVNPQRPEDNFKDKTICGCVVALCVMTAALHKMEKAGLFNGGRPSLSPLLSYAGLATVADCVSMKSGFNRRIVRKAVEDINKEVIPAWTILKRKVGKPNDPIDVGNLGFLLAPAINADSRTGGDGTTSVGFLTATTLSDAEYYYAKLTTKNTRRKEKDASMQEAALKDGSKQYYEQGRRGLVTYLPKGSHGIHGIVASRVKDTFNCPTIMFSPVDVNEKDHDLKILSGSGRNIESALDLEDMVMNKVRADVNIIGGGGHKGAMGCKIYLKDLPAFQDAFDRVVKAEAAAHNIPEDDFYPFFPVDKILNKDDLERVKKMDFLHDINRLQPYGMKFEAPLFAINGRFVKVSDPFGKGVNENAHCNIVIEDQYGNTHRGTVFMYERQTWFQELGLGDECTFVVEVQYNSYSKGPQMLIKTAVTGINSVKSPR